MHSPPALPRPHPDAAARSTPGLTRTRGYVLDLFVPLPEPAAPDSGPDDAAYYRDVLHELIGMGLDIARAVHAQAQTEATADTAALAPLAGAFDRVSRAVRRTIALARRLDDPAPRPAGKQRAAARARILRHVEDAIHRGERPGNHDRLHAELHERLDGPDLDDEIDHRDIPDIVADICRDLGIAGPPGPQPWKRRTPADIAALCARAARPPRHLASRTPASEPDGPNEPERIFRLVAAPIG